MTALIITLLILGSGLLMAEAHLPTYGALGSAGVAAFVAAIVLAVADSGGSLALAFALTVPIAALIIALGVVCIRKALTVSRWRARGGAEGLIGHRRRPAPAGPGGARRDRRGAVAGSALLGRRR